MRKLIIIFLLFSNLFSQMIDIDSFITDIYSKKDGKLKKITISLLVEGRYVEENRHKIVDALNVVISSFFLEELFTSKGKISLKDLLKNYALKKHSVEIDMVFIKRIYINEDLTIEKVIEAIKKERLLDKTTDFSKEKNVLKEKNKDY